MILIVFIVQAVVWGIATNKVIENKGYYENWFWWGFFFGIIALLVAISKPEAYRPSYDYDDSPLSNAATTWHNEAKPEYGYWKCNFCGTVNAHYVTSCCCGRNKDESDAQRLINQRAAASLSQNATNNAQANNSIKENECIEIIKKYKQLLDSGAITQEEYEKKKASLL